jgi:hypothetical protein
VSATTSDFATSSGEMFEHVHPVDAVAGRDRFGGA